MNENVLVANMTWMEYDHLIKETSPVVMVPVGAVEQHGPHLPLTTDTLVPTAVCERVARRTSNLVAPPITYGYKSTPRSGGGQHFPGTTSLDGATLINQLGNLISEFARHGVRNLAFIAGHMENMYFITEACDLGLRELRGQGVHDVQILQVGYWEFTSQETVDQVWPGGRPDWSLEHAGVMETSIMMHLHPELVHMDRMIEDPPSALPVYDLWPYDTSKVPASGILNTARGASAEHGKLFVDESVTALSNAVEEAFGDRRQRALEARRLALLGGSEQRLRAVPQRQSDPE